MAKGIMREQSIRGRAWPRWNSSKTNLGFVNHARTSFIADKMASGRITNMMEGSSFPKSGPEEIIHLGGSRVGDEPLETSVTPEPRDVHKDVNDDVDDDDDDLYAFEFSAAQCGLYPPPASFLDGRQTPENQDSDFNDHLITSLELQLPIQSNITPTDDVFSPQAKELEGSPMDPRGGTTRPPLNLSPPPLNLQTIKRPSPAELPTDSGSATSSSDGDSSAKPSPTASPALSSATSASSGYGAMIQSKFSAPRISSSTSLAKAPPPRNANQYSEQYQKFHSKRSHSTTDARLAADPRVHELVSPQWKALPPPPGQPREQPRDSADLFNTGAGHKWGAGNQVPAPSRKMFWEAPRPVPSRPSGNSHSQQQRTASHRKAASASSALGSGRYPSQGPSHLPTIVAAATKTTKPIPIHASASRSSKPGDDHKPANRARATPSPSPPQYSLFPQPPHSNSPPRRDSKRKSEQFFQQQPQPITGSERLWLHHQYRGEASFLSAWGLDISSPADREQGLIIMRQLIADEQPFLPIMGPESRSSSRQSNRSSSHQEQQENGTAVEQQPSNQQLEQIGSAHALTTITEQPSNEDVDEQVQAGASGHAKSNSTTTPGIFPPRKSSLRRSRSPGWMVRKEREYREQQKLRQQQQQQQHPGEVGERRSEQDFMVPFGDDNQHVSHSERGANYHQHQRHSSENSVLGAYLDIRMGEDFD